MKLRSKLCWERRKSHSIYDLTVWLQLVQRFNWMDPSFFLDADLTAIANITPYGLSLAAYSYKTKYTGTETWWHICFAYSIYRIGRCQILSSWWVNCGLILYLSCSVFHSRFHRLASILSHDTCADAACAKIPQHPGRWKFLGSSTILSRAGYRQSGPHRSTLETSHGPELGIGQASAMNYAIAPPARILLSQSEIERS